MRSFTRPPHELAPPPNAPDEGLVHTEPLPKREELGLFPRVHLMPGDSLFPRPVRRGEKYPFGEIIIVSRAQDVDVSLGGDGVQKVAVIGTDTFEGVVYNGKEMWKRTLNSPPK
jgi:hypothetical protein